MRDLRRFVEVGYVTASGRLVTLEVPPDAVAFAKAQGWMVFADFEPPPTFNAPRLRTEDHEDGA